MTRLQKQAIVACALTMGLLPPPSACASNAMPVSRTGKPPAKVSFIDAPSAETPAARRARLEKECRGRPNAGACLGMTGRK